MSSVSWHLFGGDILKEFPISESKSGRGVRREIMESDWGAS